LEAVILGASSVPLASPESPSDINEDAEAILLGGGGEAPACPADALSLQTTPDTEESTSSNSAFAERGLTFMYLVSSRLEASDKETQKVSSNSYLMGRLSEWREARFKGFVKKTLI